MNGRDVGNQPGYLAYQPSSYQSWGPEDDQSLDQLIAVMPKAAVAVDGVTGEFFVSTPNVRCRTRVALVLEPIGTGGTFNTSANANTAILGGDPGTLWICERERTRAGKPSPSPVRNVIGTGAAPIAVPTDDRLWGFALELETNGRDLYGRFVPPDVKADPTSASQWHVIVRYESVERLSNEEWQQFRMRFGLRIPKTLEFT
jgi:hypothetical protein